MPDQPHPAKTGQAPVIIIGASHGGISLAERLRRRGYKGSIILIDREAGLPVERPPLSKAYLQQDDDGNWPEDSRFALRGETWFSDQQVTLIDGVTVIDADAERRLLTLDDGRQLTWGVLVLATGAIPRLLPDSVTAGAAATPYYLRLASDARRLRRALADARHVAIIGGGYIGLEVAASCRKSGLDVTVIEMAERLLARVASPAAAAFFTGLHQQHGVTIHTGCRLQSITAGKSGALLEVVAANGSNSRIEADLVVAGIGVVPDLMIAEKLGVAGAGGIVVDAAYRTAVKNIYAIGDAALPNSGHGGGVLRIESVHHAQMSADIAAAAINGDAIPGHEVPWFWSEQYDIRLQSVGLVPADGEAVSRAGRRQGTGSVWSFAAGKLAAVEAMGDAQAYMVGKTVLDRAIPVSAAQLADPALELKSLISG